MTTFCMTRRAALGTLAAVLAFPAAACAWEEEAGEGEAEEDEEDEDYGGYSRPKPRFPNEDFAAPWNDELKRDDPFAPWNDPLKKDDIFAPWNDPLAGKRETNRHLRKQGERNRDWYWK